MPVRLHAKRRLRRTVAALVLVSGYWACQRRNSSEREVWAEVDGTPIYRDQVERYYRSRTASGSEAASPAQVLTFKLNILNEVINNQVLVAHASRSRIAVSEAEVDTKVAELRSPYTEAEFQQKLNDQGMNLGDLRQEVRQSLIIQKLINQEITSRIAVTEAEIAEHYERHKASFNVPEEQYHLAHIAVTLTPDPEVRNLKNDDAKNPTSAARKMEALYARLRSGEDFAVVAQEYSEDPKTAAGGGDMGFVPASGLDANPRLKEAVSSLAVGQFSHIITSSNGYNIIRLLGREAAGQRPLSDPQVQSAVRRTLIQEREQLLKAAFIDSLRSRARVTNLLAENIVAGRVEASALK